MSIKKRLQKESHQINCHNQDFSVTHNSVSSTHIEDMHGAHIVCVPSVNMRSYQRDCAVDRYILDPVSDTLIVPIF